jgi:hypothetical protein
MCTNITSYEKWTESCIYRHRHSWTPVPEILLKQHVRQLVHTVDELCCMRRLQHQDLSPLCCCVKFSLPLTNLLQTVLEPHFAIGGPITDVVAAVTPCIRFWPPRNLCVLPRCLSCKSRFAFHMRNRTTYPSCGGKHRK